jgi:predicted O-methyltransferase YrrM
MTTFSSLSHFSKVYLTALPRVLYRLTFSMVANRREALRFVENVLDRDDLSKPCPVLGSRATRDIFPVEGDLILDRPSQELSPGGTYRISELATLAAAARFIKPAKVFEIGTHVGRTGRILLLNGGEDAKLFTLDLPPEKCSHVPGADLRNTPEGKRTTFLTGDSMGFDYSNWYGQCDLVWVDACHDYDYVCRDTENALRLVAPGGWILWHDYRHTAWWSGVTKCLRQLKQSRDKITHVLGTTIAVLRVDR